MPLVSVVTLGTAMPLLIAGEVDFNVIATCGIDELRVHVLRQVVRIRHTRRDAHIGGRWLLRITLPTSTSEEVPMLNESATSVLL